MSHKNWIFESSTGKLFSPDGNFFATGYAGGNCGRNPEGINNPDMQFVHNIGPLPEGWYTFGGLVETGSHLGPYCFPLIPDVSNEMGGRSGFWCHADTVTPRCASEGCVVMPNATRIAMYKSDCHRIKVVATYQPC